jgi:hypothetical protein
MRWLLPLFCALSLYAGDEVKTTPQRATKQVLRVAVSETGDFADRSVFRATVDGQPGKVLRALGPDDDLVLLVVLDWSGEPTLLDAAREALSAQIVKLPPNHWVGLLKAQDVLQTLGDPTNDRDKTAAAIQAYPAVGKAGFLDSVEQVSAIAQRMMQKSGVRVAVLYVSDSNIYNYREDYTNPVINSSDSRDLSRRFPDQLVREKLQKVSDRLARLEAPLYFVHLNYFSDPINEAYQRGILQLVNESGGAAAFCRSRGEIASSIERVMAQASRHWSVTVEFPARRARSVIVDLFHGDRDIANRARFALGK